MAEIEQIGSEVGAEQVGQENCNLLQNSSLIPEENPIFATNGGTPGAVFVAEIENQGVFAGNLQQRLAQLLAALHAEGGIDEFVGLAAFRESSGAEGRGRPEALSEAARKKICLLLTLGYSRSLAAAQLGVARSTVTRTMQRDEDFRRAVHEAEELFEQMPLLTIMQAAQKNWRAATWLLKNHQPHQLLTRRKKRRKTIRSAQATQDILDAAAIETERSQRGARPILQQAIAAGHIERRETPEQAMFRRNRREADEREEAELKAKEERRAARQAARKKDPS